MQVEKGWGYEDILVSTDLYCMKKLVFTEKGNYFSMHFHENKDETWYVDSGSFILEIMDTKNASVKTLTLNTGSTWHNPPLLPHRLTALERNSVILEVSTKDTPEDNFRIMPGMSQK